MSQAFRSNWYNEAVAATPDLITHVEVHKMTVHDGHRLADALDDLSERALTYAGLVYREVWKFA